MAYFFELVIAGAIAGSLYALIAVAFVVVYKATRVVNFALGEMVVFATGFTALGAHKLGAGLLVGLGTGAAGMAGLAYAFNYGVLRYLVGRPLLTFIMVTIGFGAVLRAVAPVLFAGVPQSVDLPFPTGPIYFGELLLSPNEVLVGVVAWFVIAAVSVFFRYSRAGLALRAISDDEQSAMGVGIAVLRYFTLAWVLAGVLAVAGGVLWPYSTGGGFSTVLVGLKVLPIVIIGGLESIPGVLAGALLIGILESLSAGYIDPLLAAPLSGIIAYVMLIVALIFRPHGIFGEPEIRRV